MKKKEVCVKTKRMMIQMMSDEEIDNLIETSGSDDCLPRNAVRVQA